MSVPAHLPILVTGRDAENVALLVLKNTAKPEVKVHSTKGCKLESEPLIPMLSICRYLPDHRTLEN
jgi:hypothetical protein